MLMNTIADSQQLRHLSKKRCKYMANRVHRKSREMQVGQGKRCGHFQTLRKVPVGLGIF